MLQLSLTRCCAALLVLAAVGCHRAQPQKKVEPKKQTAQKTEPDKGGAQYSQLLEQASRDLARGQQKSAAEALDKLVQDLPLLSEAQQVELKRLQAELDPAHQPAKVGPEKKTSAEPPAPEPEPTPPEVKLSDVRELIDDGKWEAAHGQVEKLLQSTRDADELREAGRLKKTIEAELQIREQLDTALAELASDKPAEVEQGRDRLWQHSDRAVAALRQALAGNNPRLVANALQMLRPLQRPEQLVKLLIGIVKNPQQQAAWPVAVEYLGSLNTAGAGRPLLELARQSELAEQRMAAMQALALIPDPPAETFAQLLPALLEDGPELVAALRAAANAALVHKQHDLVTGRGFESISGKQRKQLAALAGRLEKLIGNPSDAPATPAAEAAWRLAVATGQQTAGPIPGIRVIASTNTRAYGPASAVLDGNWDSLELKEGMWITYGDKHPWIVLDLGRPRTITGVRIWNFNYSNARQRGWREVEIYIADTPSPMVPTLSGELPMAPGKKEMGDFGYTLPVHFARGRYIKLQARQLWSGEDQSGLSEVQVLGF